jgi:hypothetical protein
MSSSMSMRGLGSKVSPIVISDDEGEVSLSPDQPQGPHLTASDVREHSQAGTVQPEAPKSMKMMLNIGYTPGLGLGRNLDGKI